MKDFKNKKIWITGASSGIGKALALELAKYSPTIILSSRNKEKLETVKQLCEEKGATAFVQTLDLENYDSIKQATDNILSKFQTIDLLINNGGITQRSLVHETDLSVYRRIMEIDYFGQITLTKLVLPAMLKAGKGHIAVTSSIAGVIGFYQRTAYSAAKHAVAGFFEALYFELNKKGIDVTIIFPGFIKTDISVNALDKDGKPFGKLDKDIANGIDPNICAKKIVKALKKNRFQVFIAKKEMIAVYLKRFFPPLFRILIKSLNK